jgi:peptidyl-prolyl cis-trans isomerase C
VSPRIPSARSLLARFPRLGPSTTLTRLLAGALLIGAGATASTQLVVHARAALPDDAVFRIDGEVTTVDELNERIDVLGGLYGIEAPDDVAKLDQFNRDTAKAIAVSKILETAALKEGVVVAEKTANDQLGKLIRENFDGDRAAFIENLGQNGVSQDDVIEEIKRQLTSAELFSVITKDVPPATEAQVRDYFDGHRDELVSPEQRRIANIVVEEEGQATRIARLARGGKDFATLARTWSVDGETVNTGGDLGFVAQDELEADYGSLAFAAAKGVVFGPVKGEFGWNVGVVTEISPSQPLAFDTIAADIENKINSDAIIAEWQRWLEQTIREADVEYADAYRPDNPDSAPETSPTP